MTERARKVAVILGAATLASGAAVGVSAATKPDNVKPAAERRFGPPGGAGAPGPRGGFVTELASALGVSEAKLQEAMRNAGPPAGGPEEMAAALGKELGLPAAKVQSALQSLRPRGGPPPAGANPPIRMR